MKEITITIPDNCELKQDGNTYTIVEKEKKLIYEDIAKKLFSESCFYISTDGEIESIDSPNNGVTDLNNCTSKRQAEKLLAINKLMNVAKYLNDGWQLDCDDIYEHKWCIIQEKNCISVNFHMTTLQCPVYFKSKELAEQAIEILGEETIKLALCTDY